MLERLFVNPRYFRRAHTGVRFLPRLLPLALLLAVTGPVEGQTGTISGRVLNSVTAAPVSRAEVLIDGTQIGALTREDGTFVLVNVPLGTYQLRVRLVGFAQQTQAVVVRSGQETRVTLELRQQALALDEIVVTGTATAARRREIGSSINVIDLADVQAKPVQSIETLLQASGPGVQMVSFQGQVGASGSLQLRGPTSVSQGNEPLIYIDGIRMSTARIPAAGAFDGRNTRVSGFSWNDINVEDIERIEIIKGAAASSLYGTEASGGVIQIFTKRGSEGTPQWSFSTSQGANFWPVPSSTIREHETSLDIDVVKRTGYAQRYTGSVRGGVPGVTYYIAANGSTEEGIIDTQWSKHWSVSGHFEFDLFEGATLQLTNNFTHRRTRQVADGNNRYGYLLNVMRVGRGYKAGSRDQSWVLEQEYFNELDNFIGGAKFSYTHADFIHSFTFGLHHVESSNTGFQPFGWLLQPLGTIRHDRFRNRLLTGEYSGTWLKTVSETISSKLTFGGQLYDERNLRVIASGQDFPGPGDHTVSSAARTSGSESRIRQVNAGFLVQEILGVKDRLFLTGGVRFDGSSAFGDDYGFQVYPKGSVSYVISDMASWPSWWNSFRLRGAVGLAGKAPGAFDALRTWNPISGKQGQAGLSPGNLGNPDLGPEKTTEIELGLDSDMFGSRLSVEFTYYNSKTKDALFSVVPIPSQGFLSTQLENVGEMVTKGIELGVNAVLVDAQRFNWRVGGEVTTIHSLITDMGGAAPFGVGRIQEIREGFAPPSFFGRKVTNPDEFADPIFERDAFLGSTFPTTIVNLHTDVSFGALTVSALGELVNGGTIANSVGRLNTVRTVWPGCTEAQTLDGGGQTDQINARDRARCLSRFNGADQWVENTDFFKLRDITAIIRIPQRMLPFGMRSATFAVSGSNLFTITDYTGVDPEIHQGNSVGNAAFREDYYSVPPRRAVRAKLSFSF